MSYFVTSSVVEFLPKPRTTEERKRQEAERAEMPAQAPKKPQRMILGGQQLRRDSSDRDDR